MTDWWAHITNLDGTTSTSDFASMVKSQNDIYMVMENAKTNNDNLEASLANGYITRGEVQLCAKRICQFAMYTHAYERFKANGFKYDVSDLDTSNMSVAFESGTVALDEPIDVHFAKSGRYIVEVEFTSPLTSLAQIAINLNIDKAGACTLVSKGTDGGIGVAKTSISIMNWAKQLKISSKADVKIKSVKFLM
jgi:beta-glucosidase